MCGFPICSKVSFLRAQAVLFLCIPSTQKCLHMQAAHNKHLINITKWTSEYINCQMVMGPVILKSLVLKKTFS